MTGVLVLGRGRRSGSRDEEMVEPGKLLQRDAWLLAKRALPSVEAGLRDLVVTLSANDQHRTCESRRHRLGVIAAKVEEIRPRQRSTAGRRDRGIGAKGRVFDGGLESERLVDASLRLRIGSQRSQITHLFDDEVLNRPGVPREDDQSRNAPVALRDSRSQIAALAVAHHDDTSLVDARGRCEQADCRAGRIDYFFFDGDDTSRIHPRTFRVPEDRHAMAGQPEGDVPEHLHAADALVGILRPGAVHEHDGGNRPRPHRHRKEAR